MVNCQEILRLLFYFLFRICLYSNPLRGSGTLQGNKSYKEGF